MPSITLRLLTKNDRDTFYDALEDNWEDSFDFVHYWHSLAECSFDKYVELAPGFIEGKYIPAEHVPAILLFAFNRDGKIVGRTSIRLRLTEHLLKEGGHIGYGVCPKFRKQGYATEILKASLIYVKKNFLEIDKVLLTCDEGNIGSQKTIEKNLGNLENIIDIGKAKRKMRYWIQIN